MRQPVFEVLVAEAQQLATTTGGAQQRVVRFSAAQVREQGIELGIGHHGLAASVRLIGVSNEQR
jgi:hypothetical protein